MIYKYTRYRKTPVTIDRSTQKVLFTSRPLFSFPTEGSMTHVWKEGDRLDVLAYEYYGTSQLWWVILESNPKYKWEGEISTGDQLVIPDVKKVVDRI